MIIQNSPFDFNGYWKRYFLLIFINYNFFKEQKKYKYASIGNNDDYVRRIFNKNLVDLISNNICSAEKLLRISKLKEYILYRNDDGIVDFYRENK